MFVAPHFPIPGTPLLRSMSSCRVSHSKASSVSMSGSEMFSVALSSPPATCRDPPLPVSGSERSCGVAMIFACRKCVKYQKLYQICFKESVMLYLFYKHQPLFAAVSGNNHNYCCSMDTPPMKYRIACWIYPIGSLSRGINFSDSMTCSASVGTP